jgi:hypothetical protein
MFRVYFPDSGWMTGHPDSGQLWPATESYVRVADDRGTDEQEELWGRKGEKAGPHYLTLRGGSEKRLTI